MVGRDNVVLIGMTGCGKTTIGKLIAEKLNYDFIDMDDYIEEISEETIAELFSKGEDFFRNWETEACRRLSKKAYTIISAGGGVIKNAINMKVFKDNSKIIFIDRPVEDIFEDIDISKRPLLASGKEVLYKLKEERYELYNRYCDYRVENINTVDDVVNIIIDIMNL